MKKFTKTIVGVFCALLLVTSAFAADTAVKATNAPVAVETVKATNAPAFSYLWTQPKVQEEAWVFTLGGVGQSRTSGDVGTSFGADISIGRTGHLLLPLEAGLRQGFSYDGDSTTLFTTKLYSDWTLLQYKKLDVFGGANVGLTYGNTKPQWEIAPEAGLRYWLKKDVAVVGRAEFPFDLDGWAAKDTVRYFLGLQVKF